MNSVQDIVSSLTELCSDITDRFLSQHRGRFLVVGLSILPTVITKKFIGFRRRF